MRRELSRRALADSKRLHDFLAQKNPLAAQRAINALLEAMQSLEVFPERGRPTDAPGIRELLVRFGSSSYVIRYEYSRDTDTLIVLRMWHGREDRR